MQSLIAGQINTLMSDVVAKASGNPIITGTVVGYLRAMDGVNAKKWWDSATSSWSATVASCGNMTHVDDGHWELDIAAGAWIAGVRYRFYWKESGDLHLAVSEDVVEVHAPTTVSFEATIES